MAEFVMMDDTIQVYLDQFKFSCKMHTINFGVERDMPDFTTFCDEFSKFKPGLKHATFSAGVFQDFADDSTDEILDTRYEAGTQILLGIAADGASVGDAAYFYKAVLKSRMILSGAPGDPAKGDLDTEMDVAPLVRGTVMLDGRTVYTVVNPPTAPVAALAGLGAGNVDDGTHSWKITFVNALGETTGGTVSNVLNVVDKTVNGQVTLSSIPLGPTGTTSRKVYRRVAGDTGTWKLAGTIGDNTTTTINDNVADSGLGADAPGTNTATIADFLSTIVDFGTPPPGKTLYGLVAVPSGALSDVTVLVLSDDNAGMATPATAITFATINGSGKQMLSSTTNLQRYYRISVDFATPSASGDYQFFVLLGYA